MPQKKSITQEAEFLDANGVEERFGIRRSLLYLLLNNGSVRSVSLVRPGANRGKRLYEVKSIREFLSRQMDDQQCQECDGKLET